MKEFFKLQEKESKFELLQLESVNPYNAASTNTFAPREIILLLGFSTNYSTTLLYKMKRAWSNDTKQLHDSIILMVGR